MNTKKINRVKVVNQLNNSTYIFTGQTWEEAHRKAERFIARVGGGDHWAII